MKSTFFPECIIFGEILSCSVGRLKTKSECREELTLSVAWRTVRREEKCEHPRTTDLEAVSYVSYVFHGYMAKCMSASLGL